MKKQGVIGLIVGITAGVAAAVAGGLATARIVKEIKSDLKDEKIVSPDGNNSVTLSCGASSFAKGITLIKVHAQTETIGDKCKFSFLVGNKSAQHINCEWMDNDHFELTEGEVKLKQCCDVDFGDEQITLMYYLCKHVADKSEESTESEATTDSVPEEENN